MIRYGLKLRSDNAPWFPEARQLFGSKRFDFIELAHTPDVPFDEAGLEPLRGIPMTVHAPTGHGFHEFVIGEAQLAIWRDTRRIADAVESTVIVLHPGQAHTIGSFFENLGKIDDPRILIENMAGLDVNGKVMFGQRIEDLVAIKETHGICLDIEKAVKAAAYQEMDWMEYLAECIRLLQPSYVHVSGGDAGSPVDEHRDLWDSTYDLANVKRMLERDATRQDVSMVFEVPKKDGALDNDMKNMEYFRGL